MKKRHFALLAFIAGSFLFMLSCGSKAQHSGTSHSSPPAMDEATMRKIVDEGNAILENSLRNKDSVGFAEFYTTDCRIMAPNWPYTEGKAAAIPMAAMIIGMDARIDLNTVAVTGCAERIIEQGTYTMTNGSGASLDKGKYIVIWKQEGGKWKAFQDIWNSDILPPGMK